MHLIDSADNDITGGRTLNDEDLENWGVEGFYIPGQTEIGVDIEDARGGNWDAEVLLGIDGPTNVTHAFSYSMWFAHKSSISGNDKQSLLQLGTDLDNHFAMGWGSEGFDNFNDRFQDVSFVFTAAEDGNTIYRRYVEQDFINKGLGDTFDSHAHPDGDHRWVQFAVVYDPVITDTVKLYFDTVLFDTIPLNGLRFGVGSDSRILSVGVPGRDTHWLPHLRMPGRNTSGYDNNVYDKEWSWPDADMYVNNLRFFMGAIAAFDTISSRQADAAHVQWPGDSVGGAGTLTYDAVGQDGTRGSGGGGGGGIIMLDNITSSLAIAPTNPGGKGGDGYCMIEWLGF
jgi:hypothetical protein